MEAVKVPIHEHPLLPITRFSRDDCKGCRSNRPIYGGYRCNELGCESVFHGECVDFLPEIKHFSLSDRHQHPLSMFSSIDESDCKVCDSPVLAKSQCYGCHLCEFVIHPNCASSFPQAIRILHPQHPVELFPAKAAYIDKKCLLCSCELASFIYHCDVCNFSFCLGCKIYPPPVRVESWTTHEHELHLVLRRIEFTCNACGTLGDRSPYFCLQCNFMIHQECIDLPRVININRHDHRIFYTRRIGHGEEWKCIVCRKKVDGFYGAYTCKQCPSFAVHSLCATRKDVWDMIELEGMPEEEEIAPFDVIDANTIKHFSHHHNLGINRSGHGRIQPESIVCEACLLQILSEPFYNCKQCNFVLYEKCANHPRKKRHVHNNQPFKLLTDARHEVDECDICEERFTGFRYKAGLSMIIDVRCAAISDTLKHGSHQHHLYYYKDSNNRKSCRRCGTAEISCYRCDECDYTLDRKCAQFPEKVMKNRYDDHPLFLSYGDMDMDDQYWCEACERKVDPKGWFYTCNECGTLLHISCVVGDFSYIMPGSVTRTNEEALLRKMLIQKKDIVERIWYNPINGEVVSNNSICRPLCSGWCESRCKLPSILKVSKAGGDVYFCSSNCKHLRK